MSAGNQLLLTKKGRTRSGEDDCPICQLPLPLDGRQTAFKVCGCWKKVCKGCLSAAEKRGMRDCPFSTFANQTQLTTSLGIAGQPFM